MNENPNLDNIVKQFELSSEDELNEALVWLSQVPSYLKVPKNVEKLINGLKKHFDEDTADQRPVYYENKDYILKNLRKISKEVLKNSDYSKLDLDSLSTQKLTEI